MKSVKINAVSSSTYILRKLVRKTYLTRKLRTKLYGPKLFGFDAVPKKLSNPPAFFFSKRKLYYEPGLNRKMSNSNNCVFLCHFSATGLLCAAIMSDHWEEIYWDKKDLIHVNVNLTWYLNDQVARLESSVNHRNKHRVAKSSSFLVSMHGGIWIMCVSLSGTYNFYNVKPRTHIFCTRFEI